MSVHQQTPYSVFTGNGITTVFPFAFKILAAGDLAVYVTGALKTLNLDYTVSGVGADAGGTVTLRAAPALGASVTIIRSMRRERLTDYQSQRDFPASSVNPDLDRAILLLQDMHAQLGRAIRTPADEIATIPVLPPQAGRAGKFIAFDTNGQPIASIGTGNDRALRTDLAATAAGIEGGRLVGLIYPSVAGAVALNLHDYIEDDGSYNAMGFIPANLKSAIRNHASHADLDVHLQTAINAAGGEGRALFFPRGRYVFANTLKSRKPHRLWIRGERASYFATRGTVLRYTGLDRALDIGIADGDPDATGKTEDFRISELALEAASSSIGTAIRVTNTALGCIERIHTRFFGGKVIDLRGGNVITKILDCELSGAGNVAGNCCIWMGDYQFGNYVTHIHRNHIYASKYAIRCAEGRYLDVADNTVEGIHGDIYVFETAGYISHAAFRKNYHEATKGYAFKGSAYRGLILKLVVTDNEFWASGDAATPNPGFGDFDKNRVLEDEFRGNWIATAARNSTASLRLPAVYPDTHVYAAGTCIARGEAENFEYEDRLARTLRGTDLLGAAGDFCLVSGARPEPFGWTGATTSGTWAATQAEIIGGPVANVPAAGDFDLASKVIALTRANRPRYFAVGLTYKGWAAFRVDGAKVFDAGVSAPNFTTTVATFPLAPNARSFTVLLQRNAGNPVWFGEMRIFEIGSADFNVPGAGALGNAMSNAVRRSMKRGAP